MLPASMVMRDALDGGELTRLDLADLERTYSYPYMVIHRSDLHGIFLRACRRAGVGLVTDARVTGYENTASGARVRLADGRTDEARIVIAADGLHSVARRLLVEDEPVGSSYVAYRAAVPIEEAGRDVDLREVSVHVGRAATSSSTACAAARCSTRSRSSNPRRPARAWRSGARPTMFTPIPLDSVDVFETAGTVDAGGFA
ncbi:hypothetical protein [Microbispora hainanensis]|uniref:hypothetical protein n=1 Tax=Microbispora hainanensis TaxID=568844 RepID=UPI0032504194